MQRRSTIFHYKKTWGHYLRDTLDNLSIKLMFMRKWIFPNFIAVHYFYVITMVLLATFLTYPCENFKFIDILFIAAGCSTQGGLSTIEINNLNLYQQIIFFIICCLTTPIFIHSTLAFVRLYWFERYFDNIKDISHNDFLRRRTMTLNQLNMGSNNLSFENNDNENIQNNNERINSFSLSYNTNDNEDHYNKVNFQERLFTGKSVTRDKNHTSKRFENVNLPQTNKHNIQDIYKSIKINQMTKGSGNIINGAKVNHDTQNNNNIDMIETNNCSNKNNNSDNSIYFVKPPQEQQSYTDVDEDLEGNFTNVNDSYSSSNRNTEINFDTSELYRDVNDSEYNNYSENSSSLNKNDSISPMTSLPKLQFDIVKPPRSKSKEMTKNKNNYNNIQSFKDRAKSTSSTNNLNDQRILKQRRMTSVWTVSNPAKLQLSKLRKVKTELNDTLKRKLTNNFDLFSNANDLPRTNTMMSANYVSWEPRYGRNSIFIGLNRQQRDELGGVEYRSIKLLCLILLSYYVIWNIISYVLIVPWIVTQQRYVNIVGRAGVSPTWWGFFTAMSSFNDLGLMLTPDSMMQFQFAVYPIIIMMWFIIIGNTGFPVLLRFIIWIIFKLSPKLSARRECSGFLLDHPRRCFTLLFPSAATWWLFITLLVLNLVDWFLFLILDFNSPPVDHLPKGIRTLAGLFQSVSTRTAGFNIVNLGELHPSIQVSYMLMMYVSVLPLAISVRRTNVYEEQSLGIYGGSKESQTNISTKRNHDGSNTADNVEIGDDNSPDENKLTRSFISSHLRRQLSFDLWFIFLGLFIICICESENIQNLEIPGMTVFTILFEIVSAYGTVGLSLGFPNTNTSLSAQFSTLSKLVIIAMLIRGRHRGLPYTLDRAIILPDRKLQQLDNMISRSKHKSQERDVDPIKHYLKKRWTHYHSKLNKMRREATVNTREP